MGRALEIIHAQGTNIGAGPTTLSASPGDSLQVRNSIPGTKSLMLQTWNWLQFVGYTQIFSSMLHDTTRGMRFSGAALTPEPFFPYGAAQILTPQDTLTLQGSAADAAGDIEYAAMLNYYEDLPGASALLATWDQINGKIKNITTVANTITTLAAGGYSGSQALNAGSDLLHANTYYALLGASFQVAGCSVTIKGPDTSNLRVGLPCTIADRQITGSWFKDLSQSFGLPCIPLINSANKAGTFIEGVGNENAAAIPFSLILAELGTELPI
jgi:hypothetical protein